MSMWLIMDMEKKIMERSTYSFLDWLGDVGGLFDGLKLIILQLIYPFITFVMNSKILTQLFVELEDGPNESLVRKHKPIAA